MLNMLEKTQDIMRNMLLKQAGGALPNKKPQSPLEAEGERLQQLRKKLDISVDDIFKKADIKRTEIHKLETGAKLRDRPLVYAKYLATMESILDERQAVLREFLEQERLA